MRRLHSTTSSRASLSPLRRYFPSSGASRTLLLPEVRSLADVGSTYIDDDSILLLVRNQTPPAPACPDRPAGRATRLLDDEPSRVYVPLLMRRWTIRARHVNASCHLSVVRTPAVLERFVGGWARTSVRGRGSGGVYSGRPEGLPERRRVGPSPLFPRRPALASRRASPTSTPLPVSPRGNTCILLFTDVFSGRAYKFAVSAADSRPKPPPTYWSTKRIPLFGVTGQPPVRHWAATLLQAVTRRVQASRRAKTRGERIQSQQ